MSVHRSIESDSSDTKEDRKNSSFDYCSWKWLSSTIVRRSFTEANYLLARRCIARCGVAFSKACTSDLYLLFARCDVLFEADNPTLVSPSIFTSSLINRRYSVLFGVFARERSVSSRASINKRSLGVGLEARCAKGSSLEITSCTISTSLSGR